MPGLLIGGKFVPVPGVEVISPLEQPWAFIGPRDCKSRPTRWVRQIICHTTKGEWPQRVVPGKGPTGRDKRTAEFWQGAERQSAAHLVVDSDGSIVCLADLLEVEAYHATVVNRWSVGIETYQEQGGVIYQAAIDSTVKLVATLCRAFGIQFQMPKVPYRGHPLKVLEADGGPGVVGIFGHRDVTDHRGKGDPGEAIMAAIALAGADLFDFDKGDDRIVWRARQMALKEAGHSLVVDGVPGPGTRKALAAAGYRDGLFIQPPSF